MKSHWWSDSKNYSCTAHLPLVTRFKILYYFRPPCSPHVNPLKDLGKDGDTTKDELELQSQDDEQRINDEGCLRSQRPVDVIVAMLVGRSVGIFRRCPYEEHQLSHK